MDASYIAWKLPGAFLLLFPSYLLLRPWVTRSWPVTTARVIQVQARNPDSPLAKWRRHNEGVDYGIEYEVDGFAARSTAIVPDQFEVRYHADNPNRYSVTHAYKPWFKWTLTLVCLIAGVAILSTTN